MLHRWITGGNMDYNITTKELAYRSISEMTELTRSEIEKIIHEDNDYNKILESLSSNLKEFSLDTIKIYAFHVTTSSDECKSIKENGLFNLQRVLSSDTRLCNYLKKKSVIFDIGNKTFEYSGKRFNIDYEQYRNILSYDSCLKEIARRIYDDNAVNGFLTKEGKYASPINETPEILLKIYEKLHSDLNLTEDWKKDCKAYIIYFFAYLNQIQMCSFDLEDEYDDSELIIKLLEYAIDKVINNMGQKILYIKNDIDIPAEQITNIMPFKHW